MKPFQSVLDRQHESPPAGSSLKEFLGLTEIPAPNLEDGTISQ